MIGTRTGRSRGIGTLLTGQRGQFSATHFNRSSRLQYCIVLESGIDQTFAQDGNGTGIADLTHHSSPRIPTAAPKAKLLAPQVHTLPY